MISWHIYVYFHNFITASIQCFTNKQTEKTVDTLFFFLLNNIFTPSTLSKNLIKIKSNFAFLNETLNFFGKFWRKNPHQSLGSKPVLGSLLVISLGHVREHQMSSLVDVMNDLQFSIVLRSSLQNPLELWLILGKHFCCDSSKLSIFSNLVRRSGTHWLSIDIHIGLLSHIEPDDLPILGVDAASHLLQTSLDTSQGGLTTAVDLVSWHSSEVGTAWHRVRQLLDLLKVVSHGSCLPYFWRLSHPG